MKQTLHRLCAGIGGCAAIAVLAPVRTRPVRTPARRGVRCGVQ